MIAEIAVTPESGIPITASLNDAGRWISDMAILADYLNAYFDPRRYDSPACGPFGAAVASLAAESLSGKLTMAYFPASPPGRIH